MRYEQTAKSTNAGEEGRALRKGLAPASGCTTVRSGAAQLASDLDRGIPAASAWAVSGAESYQSIDASEP